MTNPITLLIECPVCGKEHEITVEIEDCLKYNSGELVQNCFPYLSADEREMLISGLCPTCWKNIFGEDDE